MIAESATRRLHENRFGLQGLDRDDLQRLFVTLRRLRLDAGDFLDRA
jgi:hypothetical protein